MNISAPRKEALPPSRWKAKSRHVERLLEAVRALPDGHMIEVGHATQSYIKTTCERYGLPVATRKMENGTVGVWRR